MMAASDSWFQTAHHNRTYANIFLMNVVTKTERRREHVTAAFAAAP